MSGRRIVLAVAACAAAVFTLLLVRAGDPLAEISYIRSSPSFGRAALVIGFAFRRGWQMFASASECFTVDGMPSCGIGLGIVASILVGVWRRSVGGALLITEGIVAFYVLALRATVLPGHALLLGWLLTVPVVMSGVLLLMRHEEEALETSTSRV